MAPKQRHVTSNTHYSQCIRSFFRTQTNDKFLPIGFSCFLSSPRNLPGRRHIHTLIHPNLDCTSIVHSYHRRGGLLCSHTSPPESIEYAIVTTVTIGRRHKNRHQKGSRPRPRFSNMGNENSTLVSEDAPTQTLESRDLKSVAKLIKDGRVRRIIVMTGAGISTAAGSMLY